MNRKAMQITIGYVIAIIIGIVLLSLLLYFLFASPGGPSEMSAGFLDFLGQRTSDIESTMP